VTAAAFTPPFIAPADLPDALRGQGYAVLSPQGVSEWLGAPLSQLEALHAAVPAQPLFLTAVLTGERVPVPR